MLIVVVGLLLRVCRMVFVVGKSVCLCLSLCVVGCLWCGVCRVLFVCGCWWLLVVGCRLLIAVCVFVVS